MDKGEGIFKLKKTNGEQTKTLEEINKVIEDFYGELYEEKHIEKQSTTEILKNIEKKIDGSTFLTRDFNLLELHKCLSGFKRGKITG